MTNYTLAGAAAAALLGWMSTADAGSVTLVPDNALVALGRTVTFSYNMDFSDDSTFGGGTDFWYDPSVLAFQGWFFEPASSADPSFHRAPDDCLTSIDPGCADSDFAGAQLRTTVIGRLFGSCTGVLTRKR